MVAATSTNQTVTVPEAICSPTHTALATTTPKISKAIRPFAHLFSLAWSNLCRLDFDDPF
jgi:hypothetical protein